MSRALVIVLLTPAILLAGCRSAMRSDPTEAAGAADVKGVVLGHGYALLYSTIDDDSSVDKVLIIKGPSPQVADLIREIAHFTQEAKSQLEAFAKADPTLSLKDEGLPAMETNTRDAISSATSKQIVFSGGREFEFRILLTQHEALNYITHLAATLSKQETMEDRKRYLVQVAELSGVLHDRVIAQLKAPYVGQPKP